MRVVIFAATTLHVILKKGNENYKCGNLNNFKNKCTKCDVSACYDWSANSCQAGSGDTSVACTGPASFSKPNYTKIVNKGCIGQIESSKVIVGTGKIQFSTQSFPRLTTYLQISGTNRLSFSERKISDDSSSPDTHFQTFGNKTTTGITRMDLKDVCPRCSNL